MRKKAHNRPTNCLTSREVDRYVVTVCPNAVNRLPTPSIKPGQESFTEWDLQLAAQLLSDCPSTTKITVTYDAPLIWRGYTTGLNALDQTIIAKASDVSSISFEPTKENMAQYADSKIILRMPKVAIHLSNDRKIDYIATLYNLTIEKSGVIELIKV